MFDQRLHRGDVIGIQTHARTNGCEHFDTDFGVVTGIALSDVVKPCAEHQEVGSRNRVGKCCGIGNRLPKVTINREAVIRVALGLAANRCPLG